MVTASERGAETREREVNVCTETCLLGTEPGRRARQAGVPGGSSQRWGVRSRETKTASSSHRAALLQSRPHQGLQANRVPRNRWKIKVIHSLLFLLNLKMDEAGKGQSVT